MLLHRIMLLLSACCVVRCVVRQRHALSADDRSALGGDLGEIGRLRSRASRGGRGSRVRPGQPTIDRWGHGETCGKGISMNETDLR